MNRLLKKLNIKYLRRNCEWVGIEYQQSQDTIQLSMVEACPENWFFNSMDAKTQRI